MRIVIVSDVHANSVALEAVLTDAGEFDSLWCLGDTIGYGPRPNECIQAMREHAQVAISGNHDWACIGKVDLEDFNPDARIANEWNGKQLTPENLDWLSNLTPLISEVSEHPACTLAHGSPRDPVWEYLLSREQARVNFNHPNFPGQLCFIGHSHVPLYFRLEPSGQCERVFPEPEPGPDLLELTQDMRYIVNPGSVGQPRNQDPRACYAVLDLEARTIRFHRVAYDIPQTQEQMRAVRLPIALIHRLEYGI